MHLINNALRPLTGPHSVSPRGAEGPWQLRCPPIGATVKVLIAGLELKKSNPLMNAWMVKEVDAPYQEGIETIDGSHYVVPAGAEGPPATSRRVGAH